MVIIMAVGFIAIMPSCGLLVTPITVWIFIIGAVHTANQCLGTSQMGIVQPHQMNCDKSEHGVWL
jgi:hypothetical protein